MYCKIYKHNGLGIQHRRDEENFQILAALFLTPGSVPQAPSDSTDNSIDFSELMTKPEKIIESPGAQDWDTIFDGLSNLQSVKNDNPSNHFRFEANLDTLTSLSVPNPVPLPQNPGSEKSKPLHGKFFEEIIKDSMTSSSLENSQNPEVRRLRSTASSLAATALAPTTNDRYGRAWGHFKAFCSTNGFDPFEASGPVVATWLVCRAEQTSSPNVLESDLKSIKCFRLTAK